VSSLAAYWDTASVGCTFRKGNFDTAENIVSAAWALAQYSEVGYHLGQIKEKHGNKDEAIHLYALASVAKPSGAGSALRAWIGWR